MTPRRLEPIAVPAGRAVLDLLPALRAALTGTGPALLPHSPGSAPDPRLGPGEPLTDAEDDPTDPTVAVLATSGSTGRPKGTLLTASALLASASATHDRIGGPGRWLLALPAEHVAGLQVLVRSLITRWQPEVLDLSAGFDPAAFADAAAALPGHRRYTALVPTQLRRVLDAGGPGLAALAGFDAVLVGGAAAGAELLAEATSAGVAVVTTYGMSETCGGCVYDGRPLDGVRIRLDDDGRIRLGGPTVARGYRGGSDDAAFSTEPDGVRWFRTDDAGRLDPDGGLDADGRLDPDGRLTVLGRVDDVIVTGGLKVSPAVVEAALLGLPGVIEVVVVGATDAQWGERVVAAVVTAPGATPPSLAAVRQQVGLQAGVHAAPRQLLLLETLPLRGPGKPDRTEVRRLAERPAG